MTKPVPTANSVDKCLLISEVLFLVLAAEDLDFVADALLAICARDAEAPAYTEATFGYKLRRDRTQEPVIARKLAALSPDPLRLEEVRALIDGARLTPHQHECLTLRLDGFTFADIGRLCGSTKQNAQTTFVAALGKLRRSWRTYSYTGLAEVYQSETRRRQ